MYTCFSFNEKKYSTYCFQFSKCIIIYNRFKEFECIFILNTFLKKFNTLQFQLSSEFIVLSYEGTYYYGVCHFFLTKTCTNI